MNKYIPMGSKPIVTKPEDGDGRIGDGGSAGIGGGSANIGVNSHFDGGSVI